MAAQRSKHTGIEIRHQKACTTNGAAEGRCSCSPSYRAEIFSARDGRKLRRSFPSLAAAKAWRSEAQVALRQGMISAAVSPPLETVAAAWVAGARAGAIRNRSGDVYKPSVVRGYEQSLRLRLLPDFGKVPLKDLRRADLQALIDQMLVNGIGPATIRNTFMPLRVIYRRALVRGEVPVNPTVGLEVPAVRGIRDRIASPAEARLLLDALPQERALWATAMYSGLRLGELTGLEWADVDFDAALIHVRRSWDQIAGPIAPKSRAGVRVVPLAKVLRGYLLEQRIACPWRDGLVFGRSSERPFLAKTPNDRAQRAWKRAGMKPIGLHECRHTFASFMIAAGVNPKALCTYMGHSSVTVTFDRYGHLMPGSEKQAAALLDGFLDGWQEG